LEFHFFDRGLNIADREFTSTIRMINITRRIRATTDRLLGAALHVDSSYSIVINVGRQL